MLTFEIIYKAYYKKVYKYIFFRIDQDSNYVKDITSKTFMVLIKKWQQLNIKDQKGYLKYLYRVAKNKIREY